MIASRRLASSALLGAVLIVTLSAGSACSKGQTPTCGEAGPDEDCGPYTVLPSLDALSDAPESDGGENGGDAEESDVFEPDADAAAPLGSDDASSTDASDAADGHADADSASDHISDSGHDSSG